MKTLSKIGAIVGMLAILTPTLVVADYNPTGGGTYRLQTSAGSADTTINLSSFKELVSGLPYTMSYLNSSIEYGTIEPQSNNREFISFTGITQNSDGSATLTGVTRGLSFSYPFTASSTFQLSHAAQSIFIISNPPQFTNNYVNKNNSETILGTLSGPEPTATTNYATKNYVDTHVNGGAVSTDHVSVAGTAGETFISGAVVYFKKTDSRWYKAGTAISAATTDSLIGVAQGAGTAGQSISGGVLLHGLDSTQVGMTPGVNIFMSATAGATSTATSTLAIGKALSATQLYVDTYFFPRSVFTNTLTFNGVTYTYPSTQGASSTVMTDDGSGNLSWTNAYSTTINPNFSPASSANTGSTTLLSFNVPANALGTANTLKVRVYLQNNNNCTVNIKTQFDISYGGASTTMRILPTNGSGCTEAQGYLDYVLQGNKATNSQSTFLSSMFDTGATQTATSTAFFGTSTLAVDSTAQQRLLVVASSTVGGGQGNILQSYLATVDLVR